MSPQFGKDADVYEESPFTWACGAVSHGSDYRCGRMAVSGDPSDLPPDHVSAHRQPNAPVTERYTTFRIPAPR